MELYNSVNSSWAQILWVRVGLFNQYRRILLSPGKLATRLKWNEQMSILAYAKIILNFTFALASLHFTS